MLEVGREGSGKERRKGRRREVWSEWGAEKRRVERRGEGGKSLGRGGGEKVLRKKVVWKWEKRRKHKDGWMDGWMDGWSVCRGEDRNSVVVLFTGGHRLQGSEAGNKAIAHSCGAASILLVTTSHRMTYMHLVFHQQYDSRCLGRNKHVCACIHTQTYTHTHTHTCTLEMTGEICSSFLMWRENNISAEKPTVHNLVSDCRITSKTDVKYFCLFFISWESDWRTVLGIRWHATVNITLWKKQSQYVLLSRSTN